MTQLRHRVSCPFSHFVIFEPIMSYRMEETEFSRMAVVNAKSWLLMGHFYIRRTFLQAKSRSGRELPEGENIREQINFDLILVPLHRLPHRGSRGVRQFSEDLADDNVI